MSDAVFLAAVFAVCEAEEAGEPKCDHIGYSPFTIRKEICGSDGQTYSNEKHLEFENCLYRRGKENQSAFQPSGVLIMAVRRSAGFRTSLKMKHMFSTVR
jgi:hypothetical protein